MQFAVTPWDAGHPQLVLKLEGVSKRYGATQALSGVSLELSEGQVLGIIGHNGAGKSTLARVITGLTVPDAGEVSVGGDDAASYRHSPQMTRRRGFRMVFQELSLCPALRVFENVPVAYPQLYGLGWQRRCQDLIAAQLEAVFPVHRINPTARIVSLSLPQRQMVEIAMATLEVAPLPRLLLLDEPTASLTEEWSSMLFQYLRQKRDAGLACVIISHRVPEIRQHTDKAIVLRDGRVVARRKPSELTLEEVVALMGGEAHYPVGDVTGPSSQSEFEPGQTAITLTSTRLATPASGSASAGRTAPVHGSLPDAVSPSAVEVVRAVSLRGRGLRNVDFLAKSGEIVGLGGLEGHGQRELLHAIWRRRRRSSVWRAHGLNVRGPIAYVSGDRKIEGIFPVWSVTHNLSVSVMSTVSRWGLVSPTAEASLFQEWSQKFQLRGRPDSPIVSLSGGNQQKVLIARALASDAALILLDDPLRGVDVTTKQDVYRLLRDEAERGRCFIWFSTENEGLQQCDRVYVMRGGSVVDEMTASEASDDQLIASSISSG